MNYNAFISYRHSDLDMFVAKQVHKRLETFKVPRKVQKETGIKKIERVFRDQEELPIGSNLSDNISQALENSEYLIVICSPRTPESYWVQTEIKTFIEMHDRDHVLAVLIEGEPEESFPEALRFDENGNPVEPLAADVRGETRAAMKKKMPTEFMRLAAPLLHCTYDDLRQRHKERQMHRMMAIMSGVMALGVAFGGYYAYTAAQIQKNYEEKQINQSKYLSDTALDLMEDGDRITAVQVALEALPYEQDRPYVAKAEYALAQSLNVYSDGSQMGMERSLTVDQPVADFRFSPDGEKILIRDTGSKFYVFDKATGEMIFSMDAPLDEEYKIRRLTDAYLTDQDTVIAGYEECVICYDFEGNEVWNCQLDGVTDYVSFNNIYYNKDTHQTVTMSIDCVCVIDENGKIVMTYENPEVEEGQPDPRSFTSNAVAFSPDGKRFAIGRSLDILEDGTAPGSFSVFDIATGEMTEYQVPYQFVSRFIFIDDTHVAVSCDQQDPENSLLLTGNGKVCYYDLAAGSESWEYDFTFTPLTMTSSSFEFFVSDFDGDDGNHYQLLNCYVDNHFFSLDVNTGAEWFKCDKSSSITGHNWKEGDMVVLWERGGYMDVLTLEDRMEHNDNTKDTKLTILKAQARGGVIAVKQYSSPNLVLLSYPTDPNMETFIETTDSTDDAMFTEDGKYVVVRTGVSGDHTITAYDFKSGKELGSITCASYDLAVMGHDHDFFVYHQGGKDCLEKYEISDKGLELVGSMEDVYANNDNIFNLVTYSFLGYGYGGYTVIDLDTMKVSFQDDQINIHCAATGGENGNTIAFISDENVVHVKNGKTNSETLIREDSMKAILGYEGGNNLAVSPDGNYIALLCLDNQVRIYDMSKEMIIAEVPLGGRSFCFLHFTPDSQHLLMQGNDYYLHVYDIEKGAMVQDNSAQMYHISEVEYLENDKGEVEKIALHAGSVMYLLTPDTYEVTAHIINGCDISLKNDIILCAKYKAVVTFPYYTLDELYEIAEEQTGGERLSPEKRVQLNVD